MTSEGEKHAAELRGASAEIRARINGFTLMTFRCRGGRLGSGMGTLLEALWGFYSRQVLSERLPGEYDIAWIVDHAYNDFALLRAGAGWDSSSRSGELLRIEAKSMNLDTDERKGHFDALAKEIGDDDLLLVLVWRWAPAGERDLVHPLVVDEYLGPAREVAALRDALHVARGGSFVESGECPDCREEECPHVGEPLNAKGVRERQQGPPSTKGRNASSAQNFGGLKRMLKTRGDLAGAVAAEQRSHPFRKEFMDFDARCEEL
jgi:hypothetical protein